METRRIDELRQHPLNKAIYGDIADEALIESIRQNGVLVPVLVDQDGVVISGHRRCKAARKVGPTEIPVIVRHFETPEDAEAILIESNRQRGKSTEQKAREFTELKRIEAMRAKRRQEVTQFGAVPENFPAPGDARDLAAEKVGLSGRTAEKAVRVVEAIDEAAAAGDDEKAEDLRATLEKSVDRAHKIVKTTNGTADPQESKFNRTNDNIKWAKWTWNPVTGCKHGCPYCYARDIAKRFTGHFNPEFHENRLEAPANTTLPAQTENGERHVFVCSMADLFGAWAPSEWITSVLDRVRKYNKWTYIFLTKNPDRLTRFDFPPNARVGATVDCQDRVSQTEEAFRHVRAEFKFVSCEPILGPIRFQELSLFNLLILGGESASSGAPAMQPEWEWVDDLLAQRRAAKCLLFWKDNLSIPQQYR